MPAIAERSAIHAARAATIVAIILGGILCGTACDSNEACTIGSSEGCGEGLVCEAFPGDEARCTAPVVLEGRVFDLLDDASIEGARVVALDANGGARSGVAFTDVDGRYSLAVSLPRNADGEPMNEAATLRVDASGYETFPRAPRTALPIELGGAVEEEARWVISNMGTDVGLVPRADTGGTIAGRVDHPTPGGVLVVAEQGGVAVATSITGSDGAFTLFDVPAGETTLTGYRSGLYAAPISVTSVVEGLEGVILPASSEDGLATVSGSVNIVNAPGGSSTSVILVVASTFDDAFVRGEVPSGLRAAPVSGAFSIEGVPPGRYAVLAAFENDQLVRDPDEGIAGTDIVFIDVAGATLSIDESFKVTEALAVISPGADGIEIVTDVPELVFAQDSSEDGYELRVYDTLGQLVFEDTELGPGSGSDPIRYDLAGRVTLTPGMIYQFRAYSHGRGSFISTTEDLRGVFQYEP